MPVIVEAMPPEWAYIRVYLMIASAVGTLEGVRAWFILLGL